MDELVVVTNSPETDKQKSNIKIHINFNLQLDDAVFEDLWGLRKKRRSWMDKGR